MTRANEVKKCTMLRLHRLIVAVLFGLFLNIRSEHSPIRFSGRHYVDERGTIKFIWSSTGVSCRVFGATDVSINVTLPSDGMRYRVRLNDTTWLEATTIRSQNVKPKIFRIVSGLDARYEHTVQFLKVTEDGSQDGDSGAVGFHGFLLKEGATFRPVPQFPFETRKLEFIGDSDTAGFCVDGSPGGSDDADDMFEDSTETWAAYVAAALNVSDIQVEAVSGWGVTQKSTPIQPLLRYADGVGMRHLWDPSAKWIPRGILVLIGPNDYSDDPPSDAHFIQKYSELLEYAESRFGIASSRAGAPAPIMIHVCGGSGNGLDPCRNIQRASVKWNTNTSRAVTSRYVSVSRKTWNLINQNSKKYNGCDSHYSPEGHKMLATEILPRVREALGW